MSKVHFIGIGAAKSGSTWLAQCLNEHPELQCNYEKGEKEAQFFNDPDWGGILEGMPSNYDKGLDWYKSRIIGADADKKYGEISSGYIHDPVSVTRINDHFPDSKILVILRNPIDTLYSMYNFWDAGVVTPVPETFEAFITTKEYLDLVQHHKNLSEYFSSFPRENIHVILQDDVSTKPEVVISDVYAFLDVDASFEPSVLNKRVNEGFSPRSKLLKGFAKGFLGFLDSIGLSWLKKNILRNKAIFKTYSALNKTKSNNTKLSEEARKRYIKMFESDINELEKLIEKDLSAWKT